MLKLDWIDKDLSSRQQDAAARVHREVILGERRWEWKEEREKARKESWSNLEKKKI